MNNLKLSTKNGWKPHVICDFLELKKHVMDKWICIILPRKRYNYFSTYEFLVLYTIMYFYKVQVLDIDRLLEVNWEKYLHDIIQKEVIGLRSNKILIDWEINEIEFYNLDEKINNDESKSRLVDMDVLI